MTDLYAKCPCGSGKKIKFCCRDIITDIEKIERMIRGEQRNAALEKINKLLEKHPDRPALLAMKARVQLDQRQHEEAKETVLALLKAEPENPAAHALQAILHAMQGETKPALASLHRALRFSGGLISQVVYQAYLSICIFLIQSDEIIAAYAHLLTMVAMTKGEDRSALQLLVRVTSSEQLPGIFHGVTLSNEAPDDATWKREFDLAMENYYQGDWTTAAELFKDMNRRILDEPILLRNQALLDVWTCDTEEAVRAFRTYASIREVQEDDAVEAEACALVLEYTPEEDLVDVVAITVEIPDAEKTMETLLSCDTARSLNPAAVDVDGPPPKGLFVLYEREFATEDDAPPAVDDLVQEVCSILVFGKETDKPARVEIAVSVDSEYEQVLDHVSKLLDITIPRETDDARVLSRIHKLQHTLRARFYVPETTTPQQMHKYHQAWYLRRISSVWPDVPLAIFNGKSPREAAKDRKLKRKVLATILNLEMSFEQQPIEFDFNDLREALGLPKAEPIHPEGVDLRRLSPAQVRRLDYSKLEPKELARLFETVSVRPNGQTLHRIGLEILSRGDVMSEFLELVEVRARLAETAPSSDESLEHLAAARELAVAQGDSPAPWLVSELDYRIERQELDIAQRLVSEIQTRYIREPGVLQMFSEVLAKYGLISGGSGTAPAAAVSQAQIPAEVGAAASADSPAGVWTPDAPGDAPGDTEPGESKIWMPGME